MHGVRCAGNRCCKEVVGDMNGKEGAKKEKSSKARMRVKLEAGEGTGRRR